MITAIAQQFAQLPQVVAIALAGSRAAGCSDSSSDTDLYVYAQSDIPLDLRRSLAGPNAEIDNRFWEPGDEWIDPASGARIDIMYRSPDWIEDQLDGVLRRHEASLGYTTCFWYNVLHSEALFDPQGWYAALQQQGQVPYPEPLRRAIVAKNHPVLRKNQSSYRYQIELAIRRGDAISRHHRITALLASFFDIWFALERQPHPGEKRLLGHLPEDWRAPVRSIIEPSPSDLLHNIDAVLDRLDTQIRNCFAVPVSSKGPGERGLARISAFQNPGDAGSVAAEMRAHPLSPTSRPSSAAAPLPSPPSSISARIEHTAAWVSDLHRARAFYQRWFQASAGPPYSSATRPFQSIFLTLGDTRLELMTTPGEAARPAHIAISVGSREAVDHLIQQMRAAGVTIAGEPRVTGDGYYEAVVRDSESNLVEITT